MDLFPLPGCDFLVTAFHSLSWTKQIIHFSLPITWVIVKCHVHQWMHDSNYRSNKDFIFSDFSKENKLFPKNTAKTGWEQFFVNREFIEKGCDRERNFILESSPQLGIFYKTNKLNKNKTKKARGILEQWIFHCEIFWELLFPMMLKSFISTYSKKKYFFIVKLFFFNVKTV